MDERETTFSVSQLGRRIAEAVASGVGGTLWMSGVVADKRDGADRSGAVRFTVVERHVSGAVIAKMPVFVPPGALSAIRAACREAGIVVRDGIPIRLSGTVSYAVRWGTVSFEATGIDAAYTLGQLAIDRDQLIAELERRGVLAAQKQRKLVEVPLRLAVVSSSGSAAFADIRARLDASGYGFEVVCFDTAVQGDRSVASLCRAIDATSTRFARWKPDIVVVARGGGSRGDLAVFDDPRIAEAIARCPHPVLTGIGHEIDTHIADLAAWRRCSTPTDAARFIVETVERAVAATETTAARIAVAADTSLERAETTTATVEARIAVAVTNCCQRVDDTLVAFERSVEQQAHRAIAAAGSSLDHTAALVAAADPARMLERGWSITRTADGQALNADTPPGTLIETRHRAGTTTSTLICTEATANDNSRRDRTDHAQEQEQR